MTEPAKGCGCRFVTGKHDYMGSHAYAERQRKAGAKQVWCTICGLWRWPAEVGPNAVTITEREHAAMLKRQCVEDQR